MTWLTCEITQIIFHTFFTCRGLLILFHMICFTYNVWHMVYCFHMWFLHMVRLVSHVILHDSCAFHMCFFFTDNCLFLRVYFHVVCLCSHFSHIVCLFSHVILQYCTHVLYTLFSTCDFTHDLSIFFFLNIACLHDLHICRCDFYSWFICFNTWSRHWI